MHARVTTVQVQPDDTDELVGILRESVVPDVVQFGPMGTLVLAGRNIGKAVLTGFWESEAKATEVATTGLIETQMRKLTHTMARTANRQVYEGSLDVPGCGAGQSKCARLNFRPTWTPSLVGRQCGSFTRSDSPQDGTDIKPR